MPKKPRVRTQIDSQQVKEAERLLESARQDILSYFFITPKKNQVEKFIFSSIWNLQTVC